MFQSKKTWIDKQITSCYNKLNKLGIEATLDKDGNLVLPDEPKVVMPDAKPEVGALKP